MLTDTAPCLVAASQITRLAFVSCVSVVVVGLVRFRSSPVRLSLSRLQ